MAFRLSFTKVRSICFLTGRSRSVYRAFRLSRLKIREYAALGYFTGLSKASW
jgi:small subunit ribosomal protein S14